jgi:hypothetical protein
MYCSLVFLTKTCMSRECYIPGPSHPPWFHYPIIIFWGHILLSSSLGSFRQPPVTSSLLGVFWYGLRLTKFSTTLIPMCNFVKHEQAAVRSTRAESSPASRDEPCDVFVIDIQNHIDRYPHARVEEPDYWSMRKGCGRASASDNAHCRLKNPCASISLYLFLV